jgi:hypothetical protein
VTKLFCGCRYEVIVYTPNAGLWSRHSSLTEARKSYREAVNNRKGEHVPGTRVELRDVDGGSGQVLEREAARP